LFREINELLEMLHKSHEAFTCCVFASDGAGAALCSIDLFLLCLQQLSFDFEKSSIQFH
jgi:hypothetical protein